MQFLRDIKKRQDRELREKNERKKFSEVMQDKPKRYQSRPTNHIKADNIEYVLCFAVAGTYDIVNDRMKMQELYSTKDTLKKNQNHQKHQNPKKH